MTYGHGIRAFSKDDPALPAIGAPVSRSTERSWRALDPDRRFALIEQALHPANVIIDGFSLAL
jgi:hypothetical protein